MVEEMLCRDSCDVAIHACYENEAFGHFGGVLI